jgi:hypothetical protein
VPVADIGHPERGAIWLEVGGGRRQDGDLEQMIWKVPEIISYLSGLFTLAPGDLIYSGTPAGVGAIERRDRLHGARSRASARSPSRSLESAPGQNITRDIARDIAPEARTRLPAGARQCHDCASQGVDRA